MPCLACQKKWVPFKPNQPLLATPKLASTRIASQSWLGQFSTGPNLLPTQASERPAGSFSASLEKGGLVMKEWFPKPKRFRLLIEDSFIPHTGVGVTGFPPSKSCVFTGVQ